MSSDEGSSKSNDKEKEKVELELSYHYFNKIVRFILLFAIIVVSGFIIYYAFNQEPGHVTFGILNEKKQAEDYPTEASMNQEIEFYITVENNYPDEHSFQLKILKGDEETKLSSMGSSGAETFKNIGPISLEPEEEWISSKQVISFSEKGSKIIIVELWEINEQEEEEFFDILWIRLNVTS